MNNKVLFCFGSLVLITLTGCGSSNTALPPEFWSTGGHRVGIAFAAVPHADAYRSSSGGALGAIIGEVKWRDLANHLHDDLDTTSFY